jgi:membrane fusion protein, multidrug efflux system
MSKRREPQNDRGNDAIPADGVASSDRTEAGDGRAARGEPPKQAMPGKRLKWGWVAALVLCILALAGYLFLARSGKAQSGADKKGGGAAARSVPVAVAPAKKGDVAVYLTGLGNVTPNTTVTVKSLVDGQLMEVLFREGQIVRSGQLLARIDPRPFEAQLALVEGQLARDQALLKNAELDLERYLILIQQDSIAKQQLDTQEALVRQYEGTVKADQGQVESARLQLVYSRITAPIGGRVGLRLVDAGNIIHASDPNGLVVITQLQPVSVIFSIPEDSLPGLLARMKGENKIPVEAWDREGKRKITTGYLFTIDNQIDPTTGTVKLKAVFQNTGNELFPNQFVNARLLMDIVRGTVVVPAAAIQRSTRGIFVYVVKPDNTAEMRSVTLGPAQDDDQSIREGVAPGERVVVDGADRLRDGAKVELQTPGGNGTKQKGTGGRQGDSGKK